MFKIGCHLLSSKGYLDKSVANMFAAINWTGLNAATMRDYKKAVDTVFKQRHCYAKTEIKPRTEAGRVYEALKTLVLKSK